MEQEAKAALDDFNKALTPLNIRTMQLIYGALGFGVFAFFMVVVFMMSKTPVEQGVSEDVSFLNMLSLAHLAVALACFIASKIVYELVIKTSQRLSTTLTGDQCFGIIRSASIIRLALMEGAAFFGLVVILMGATEGQLGKFPVYWFNIFSSVAIIAFILAYFPSKTRLEQTFRDKFLNNI